MRRDIKELEQDIVDAKSIKEKSLAYYKLALFHDNNGREAKAIPYYQESLKFGLDVDTKSKALAWLASSLYKIGKPKEALKKCRESVKLTKSFRLLNFLECLEYRIEESL